MKFKHVVGEKVLCFEPDETKARVLYNAKIMDADIVKDTKGKKFVEYKIHFQGWNHAWDRWAEESFVLKDNEANRKLQRKLARKAIRKLKLQKGRRRHHLPGVASKVDDEVVKEEESSSDDSFDSDFTNSTRGKISDWEEDEPPEKRQRLQSTSNSGVYPPTHDTLMEDDSSSSKDENHLRRILNLDIPLSLQRRLEEDSIMITKRNMLVDLPIRPNVVQILENYVKRFAMHSMGAADRHRFTTVTGTGQSVGVDTMPPGKRLSLCQEICSDLKLLFDYTLPLALLYRSEREQLKTLLNTTNIQKNGEVEKKNISPEKEEKSNSTSKKLNFDEPSPGGDDLPVDVVNVKEDSSSSIISDLKNQSKNATIITTPKESPVTTPLSSPSKQRSISESTTSSTGDQLDHPKSHHKKKSAEDLMIEETHKYLIPNQPKLDQTGLSKDAQGRRRSSRLSQNEYNMPHASIYSDEMYRMSEDVPQSFQENDLTPDRERLHKTSISIEPAVFLRSSLRHRQAVLNPGTSSDATPSCSRQATPSVSQPLFNSTPYLDQDQFMSYAGSDVKKIVGLTKAWNWCILPSTYRPEDGAKVPPSLIYGIHHLLRLFVKLPDILIRMDIPEFKLKILIKHMNTLLKFLSDYERELFEVDAYLAVT